MNELLDLLGALPFWVSVLRIATPLILGTLGVLLCERAGVLNLGIEGIMVAGAFAGWLAVHAGAPLWGGVNEWLLLHVPLLRGFREPQKFSLFLVLAYSFYGSYGLTVLAKRVATKTESIFNYMPTALLVLPLALVPVMPFGFAGQLKPVKYPASWYSFKSVVDSESGDFKVLFLPWHQYMSYDFNPRIIANPAPGFFGSRIVSGDNAEFGDVFRDTANPMSDYVEQEILGRADESGMGKRLAAKNIKYVVIAHGPDWEQYIYMANQPDLKLVSQDTSLLVYRNTAL